MANSNRKISEDAETRIKQAAMALFSKAGHDAVTVPQIAERANVGVGSIYRLAPSKTALAQLVYDYAIKILSDYVFLPVELKPDMTNEDFFWIYWKRLVKWVQSHPDSIRCIALSFYTGPIANAGTPGFISAIEIIVEIADQQGWLFNRNPKTVTAMIAGPLLHHALNGDIDEETLMSTGRSVLRSLVPDHGPIPVSTKVFA